jgi:hypothetical protein
MNSARKQGPRFRIGDWVTFQYGPRRVSAKVVEDRGPLGVRGQRLYRVQLDEELGDESAFEMPENELDTAVSPIRQSFHVRYTRQGNTNRWVAATESGRLLRGVKAKGAVSYTGAAWEGEAVEDQWHATVGVLLEIDPKLSEGGVADDPVLRRKLAERAQQLADEMFASRHPRALIQHMQPAD